MNLRGKDAWEQAALALAAGDRVALGTVLPRLPAAAAQAIAAAAERSIRPLRNAAAVPAGVEWIGDSRFAAIFARERRRSAGVCRGVSWSPAVTWRRETRPSSG